MVQEVWGIEPDLWQKVVLRAFGRGERRISIAACHGPGKTCVAAWIFWNQILTRFPQKTVVTAPSRGQLEDALVSEVLMWHTKLPQPLQDLVECKKNRIELRAAPDESFFSARTARVENPEALQGVHSEHVLLIADEASGVPEKNFGAAAGSMSGHSATTLLLSNPTKSSGFFYDTHHKLKDMWVAIQVGQKDSPRVSDDFAEDIGRRYGQDSNAYRIRVLGEFPLSDLDTIIPAEFVKSAQMRDIVVHPDMGTVWGLDVARFGDDDNALIMRTRLSVLPEIHVWNGTDLMATAGKVKNLYDGMMPSQRPSDILIDVIGLGAGVVDRLQEQGLPVRGINVAEMASYKDQYANLKTELWFAAREWLMTRDHALPRCDGGCPRECVHERLASELVAPRYEFTSTGKFKSESKGNMKKRGIKSPNIAEAFILSFAGEPAGIVYGSQQSFTQVKWGDSLDRGIVHV